MNILDKIKKDWDFKKTTQENVISFNTPEKQNRKRNIIIGISAFVAGLITVFTNHHNLSILPFAIGAISFGSSYVFFNSTYSSRGIMCALDSTHFVIAYTNWNSAVSYSVVGTVSGTTISYGSSTSWYSGAPNYFSLSTLNSTSFVIAYTGASNVEVKIGTVSSGTISYGSAYAKTGSSTGSVGIDVLDSTHFVLGYGASSTNYGTVVVGSISAGVISYGTSVAFNSVYTILQDRTIIALGSGAFAIFLYGGSPPFTVYYGTVSGTTITPQTTATINANTGFIPVMCALDSTHFVVVYDDVTSGYTTAVLGTISGTTLSFGTPQTVYSTTTGNGDIGVVAISSSTFVVSFCDTTASNIGKACLGTVSGTTISFASPVTFYGSALSSGQMESICLLPSTGNFVIAFNISTNQGYAIVGATSSTYTISPTQGSYALTGKTTTIAKQKVLSPTYGTYTQTGYATTFKKYWKLACTYGTYALTGFSAQIGRAKFLIPTYGTYVVTGITTTLNKY